MSFRFGSALLALALVAVVDCSEAAADSGPANSNAAAPQIADRVAILGTWAIVALDDKGKVVLSVDDNGKTVPAVQVRGMKMEIAADKMTMSQAFGGGRQVMTYQLDETKKQIITTNGLDKRENVGLYELKGDDLRLCLNDDEHSKVYPTEFKSGKKIVLMTLRRVKQ